MDTIAVLAISGGLLVAKGVIIRRPLIVRLLQWTGGERSGVRTLQRMREKYGDGPLLLRITFRPLAVILSPADVRCVLKQTPDPFRTDTKEKRASLAHFEPAGSLISNGPEREERRAFSERVLESGCPVHSHGRNFSAIIDAEADTLVSSRSAELAWGDFKDGWFRIARQVVFGRSDRDDCELIVMLAKLRASANWAFMAPRRRRLRERFLGLLQAKLDRAETGSLASLMPDGSAVSVPADQVAQWLFAFDAAGIATYRALAMLALHPEHARHARLEAGGSGPSGLDLPFLRAAVLETIRLWPTTPAILRETDRPTCWNGREMPTGTGILIHVPYLHRDRSRLPFADRFDPALWLNACASEWPLVPFSMGPAECPARSLVLLLASTLLAALLHRADFQLPANSRLDPKSLPTTFDHFAMSLPMTIHTPSCGPVERT